jgi:hypothetical protein
VTELGRNVVVNGERRFDAAVRLRVLVAADRPLAPRMIALKLPADEGLDLTDGAIFIGRHALSADLRSLARRHRGSSVTAHAFGF